MPVIGHTANNGHLSFIYKLGQNDFLHTAADAVHLTAPDSSQTRRMKPSEIALLQYREKQTGRDSQLDSRITNPQTLCSFSITAEEAEAYCHTIGMKFFRKKWEDKTGIISI